MKKLFTLLAVVVLTLGVLAQAPQGISYQAVIRDAGNHLITDKPVGMKISILLGSETGTPVYVETHTTSSNVNGLVTILIGGGTPVSGNFSGINWSSGNYYIKTESDPDGGTNYSITGTSKFLSVPYAFYANNVFWEPAKDNNIFFSAGNVGIKTKEPLAALDVNGMIRASSETGSYLSLEVPVHEVNAYINYFNEENSRLFFQMNGVNRMTLGVNGRVGIGTDTPDRLLDVNGDAVIKGNLDVLGTITGNFSIESIDVSKITGLLGTGYTMLFPDVLYNQANIEIPSVFIGQLLMVSSLGFETERISTPTTIVNGEQRYKEEAGLSMEYPIVFETASATDIAALKSWFDGDKSPKAGSVIVKDLAGNETCRYLFFEYVPDKYEAGTDGRTRFTIKHNLLPNNICHIEMDGTDFGNEHSFNIATDKIVIIQGVTYTGFSPAVEVNETARTITLTMDYNEGMGIYNWAKQTVQGLIGTKDIAIIETTDGVTEISRKNYYECISIKWELIYGFSLNKKLKARVVIAYGFWENA
jgi:hypothetical protein